MSCGSGMYRYMTDRGSGIFYSGSRIRTCFHPGSRIRIYFHPGSASNKPKNWFLSYQIYEPDCSSYFLPIKDPWVKNAPDPGSRSARMLKKLKLKKDSYLGRAKRPPHVPHFQYFFLTFLLRISLQIFI